MKEEKTEGNGYYLFGMIATRLLIEFMSGVFFSIGVVLILKLAF